MRRLWRVTLIFAPALAACAPAPTYQPSATYVPRPSPPPVPVPEREPGAPITLTAQQQKAVRVGVVSGLKDPESARFGGMIGAKDRDGDITVCGFVNAKNSYGGYSGMSPFVGMFLKPPSADFRVVEVAVSDKDRAAVVKVCRQYGVELGGR